MVGKSSISETIRMSGSALGAIENPDSADMLGPAENDKSESAEHPRLRPLSASVPRLFVSSISGGDGLSCLLHAVNHQNFCDVPMHSKVAIAAKFVETVQAEYPDVEFGDGV